MKKLKLVLKKKWFDMILSDIKKEEYRNLNNYWLKRLHGSKLEFINSIYPDKIPDSEYYSTIIHNADLFESEFIDFESVIFYHGYKKDRDQMEIEFKGIEIKKAVSDWSNDPDPDKYFFAIKLGNIIRVNNIKKPNILNYPQRAIGDFYCVR